MLYGEKQWICLHKPGKRFRFPYVLDRLTCQVMFLLQSTFSKFHPFTLHVFCTLFLLVLNEITWNPSSVCIFAQKSILSRYWWVRQLCPFWPSTLKWSALDWAVVEILQWLTSKWVCWTVTSEPVGVEVRGGCETILTLASYMYLRRKQTLLLDLSNTINSIEQEPIFCRIRFCIFFIYAVP